MEPSSEQRPIRNATIATVVGAGIVAVLAELWPPVKAWLAWLWSQVKDLAALVVADYSTPGWVLFLLAALALITIVKFVRAAFQSSEAPAYQAYTTDQFYGAKWRWKWHDRSILNLWCFCPVCDGELVYDDSSCRELVRTDPRTDLFCEHCNHERVASIRGGNREYALAAVQREIRRKLRTGQAPAAPAAAA